MTRYRCHACSAFFDALAPAERHADAERHHRLEVLVISDQKEPPMSPTQKLSKDRRHGEKRIVPTP